MINNAVKTNMIKQTKNPLFYALVTTMLFAGIVHAADPPPAPDAKVKPVAPSASGDDSMAKALFNKIGMAIVIFSN